MQPQPKNIEKNSINEMEDLIVSIKSLEKMSEEQIAKELGYNEKFISQTRSRKEVSPKFVTRLQDYLIRLQNVKPPPTNPQKEESLADRSLGNLTESNKVLSQANNTLAQHHFGHINVFVF